MKSLRDAKEEPTRKAELCSTDSELRAKFELKRYFYVMYLCHIMHETSDRVFLGLDCVQAWQ